MILLFIRVLFPVIIMSLLILGLRQGGPFNPSDREVSMFAILCSVLILTLGLCVDVFLPRKSLNAIAGVFFGIVVGLLIATAINRIIDALYVAYSLDSSDAYYIDKEGLMWMITTLCCYLAVVFIMQTKDDFRFIIPYVEFSKQTKGGIPLLLDTSVIIDGRIADISTTGIITSPMIVPRFVLDELQTLSDLPDRLKRNRGRRGLDIINKMQGDKNIDLSVQDIEMMGAEKNDPVDLKLVTAAQKLNGRLVTNDYNLNKVTKIRGIEVININDLANAMRMVLLPGEILNTKIIKAGDQPGQGVGYREDGTMIVVENGKKYIGKEVESVVTSVHQTSSGRMIFAKVEE